MFPFSYHSRNVSALQTQFYIRSFCDGSAKFSISPVHGLRNMTASHSRPRSRMMSLRFVVGPVVDAPNRIGSQISLQRFGRRAQETEWRSICQRDALSSLPVSLKCFQLSRHLRDAHRNPIFSSLQSVKPISNGQRTAQETT